MPVNFIACSSVVFRTVLGDCNGHARSGPLVVHCTRQVTANKSHSLIEPAPRKDETLRFALGQITVLDRRNRIQDMSRNESWYEEAMEEHVVRAFAGALLSGIYQASEKNSPIAHFDS